jgi:hypothetical protein
MAIESDLQIFISWSGELAKECTRVLREWLPKMFDHIDPWASDVDIDAGLRGLDVLQDRLNASSFGIIVITTENMGKAWLNFEAGALSKTLGGDPTRVVPLLINFEDVYQLQGPISQFQAIKLDMDGARRLCRSIAAVIGLDALTIDSRFEWAWPSLKSAVDQVMRDAGDQPTPPEVDEKDLLSSIFQAIQSLQKQVAAMRSSASLFSGPSVKMTPATLARALSKVNDYTTTWSDGRLMQEIEEIAAAYKPIKCVTPMEKDGEKVVGVMFQDGEGLSPDDFTSFKRRLEQLPVVIRIETDR